MMIQARASRVFKEAAMPNGKPNILVIWGDDIGISNLSCYSDGLMGQVSKGPKPQAAALSSSMAIGSMSGSGQVSSI